MKNLIIGLGVAMFFGVMLAILFLQAYAHPGPAALPECADSPFVSNKALCFKK